jgi:hypothetical protein
MTHKPTPPVSSIEGWLATYSGNPQATYSALRDPETPAGTYPVFETYLNVEATEQKHQAQKTRGVKREAHKKNASLFLKIVIPVFLVAGILLGGIMLLTATVKTDTHHAATSPATSTTVAVADSAPRETGTPKHENCRHEPAESCGANDWDGLPAVPLLICLFLFSIVGFYAFHHMVYDVAVGVVYRN